MILFFLLFFCKFVTNDIIVWNTKKISPSNLIQNITLALRNRIKLSGKQMNKQFLLYWENTYYYTKMAINVNCLQNMLFVLHCNVLDPHIYR